MTGLCERLRRKGECAPSCADGSICYEWNGDDFLEAAARIEALEAVLDRAALLIGHLERSLASFERDPPDSDFQDGFRAALTTPEMIERARSLRVALAKARGDQ